MGHMVTWLFRVPTVSLGLTYRQCRALSADNGLSLQSCSLGEALDKLPVSTSQDSPNHAVGKQAMRGLFPLVLT